MWTLCVRSLMDATVPSLARRRRSAFELERLYDDPSELTVFSPETRRLATEWLTVDRSTAVRLDRMR